MNIDVIPNKILLFMGIILAILIVVVGLSIEDNIPIEILNILLLLAINMLPIIVYYIQPTFLKIIVGIFYLIAMVAFCS